VRRHLFGAGWLTMTTGTRRLVFECPIDGFRTSPLTFLAGGDPLGLDAASMQLAEHTLTEHDGDELVAWVSRDMPEGA
jgi:hypothetical protein